MAPKPARCRRSSNGWGSPDAGPGDRDLVRRDRRVRSSRMAVRVRSDVVASQILVHAEYGGVVPEVASRQHLATIVPVLRRAVADAGIGFGDLDAIAVTCGPGLVGALLVGVETAKSLAFAMGKPLVGVNHLAGHLAAVFLDRRRASPSSRTWRCWCRAGTPRSSASSSRDRRACSGRRATTPRARPSTRSASCWASAIRAASRSTSWRRRAIRAPSICRARCRAATIWTSASRV